MYDKTHRLHKVWASMLGRCYSPSINAYEHYGGRGVTVCEEWQDSFETFVVDMDGWWEGASIDRIDNDGDYCRENCRWANATTQARNQSKTIFNEVAVAAIRYCHEVNGKSAREIADAYNVRPQNIHGILRYECWRTNDDEI